jgi:hypothetical protein
MKTIALGWKLKTSRRLTKKLAGTRHKIDDIFKTDKS